MNHWKSDVYQALLNSPLQKFLPQLSRLIEAWDGPSLHADAKKWEKQLSVLPVFDKPYIKLGEVVEVFQSEAHSVSGHESLPPGQASHLRAVLSQFMPWRKGPYNILGIHIDTEWRSDMKWNRVLPHISDLTKRRVLDVGCGSGYHLFRMYEAGASQVIGVDPTTLFFYQFHCLKRYAPDFNIHYLPFGVEDLPATNAFDTVFSMGVFYHRPDPLSFLKQLKAQLNKGGELVLETLVIEGDEKTVLVPSERYAQMRNVYFLPSIPAILAWLAKAGFKDAKLVDDNITSTDEQRATSWMKNHSLSDFLDPQDPSKTIEGYEAPRRATFIAYK